jgi:uncharacterized protein DUF3592
MFYAMPNSLQNQMTEMDTPRREWKVPIMLVLLGLGCISWTIHSWARDQHAHDSWPTVKAQVIAVRQGRYNFPDFRFRYTVGGVSFVEDNYRPFQVYATTTTTVYYNPANPSDFVPSEAMYYDGGLTILLGFGCVVAAVLQYRSSDL